MLHENKLITTANLMPKTSFALLLIAASLLAIAGCDRPAASGDLAADSVAGSATEHPFPRHVPAPALKGGIGWLNTDKPVDLSALRGKFVILDFWTYCCINCMHVLPELKKLERAYPNNVVVIGVHSGKFDTEHDSESIRQAIMRYEIEHPVVNDADYKIWNAYNCNSWPSLRVIDPEGNLVAAGGGEIDFATLDAFFKKALPYYRQKGELNEKPIHFALEQNKAAQTPLRYPGKILADETGGRLFIADSNHNRIVVAGLDGKLQTVIGSGKTAAADGDFAAATFNHPQGMALRGDTLYLADTENHLLRKIDLKAQHVSTIAGTGLEAHSPQQSPGAPLKTELNSPWALCIHGSDLFIAMAGAHQIWKMPLDESTIGPYAGNGREDIVDNPLDSASFAQPSGLTSDQQNLFVADSEGSSIRAVPLDPAQEVRTIVGTAGLEEGRLFTFGDIDGPIGKSRLQHCLGITYHDGRMYVADTYNNKIKMIDLKAGECKSLAGSGKHDDFFEPAGISYAAGKLYVADTNNHRIRVIDLSDKSAATPGVTTLEITGLTPPAAQHYARKSDGKRHAVQFDAGIEYRAARRVPPGTDQFHD